MPTASQQSVHCFKVIQAASAAMLQHHDSDVILGRAGFDGVMRGKKRALASSMGNRAR
jgi:hypothetical protein